jgi:hypothetical protein
MRLLPAQTVLVLALLALAGCTNPLSKGRSVLRQPELPADSIVLDVFFARFPLGDPEANEQLWQEVDEQHFPAELRKRLAQNGFRVGLVGSHLPVALSKLLDLKDKPAPAGAETEIKVADLGGEPRVERRHMPLRSGGQGQLIASPVYDQLTVLLCEPAGLCGQTYAQAQAMLTVTATAEADGRVRVQLVPELHHDQPKQHWVGDQGAFRLDTSRPKRVFDDLGVSASLAPGAMLLVTSLPSRPGSLGHHFFTEKTEPAEQKLLVVRLAQTQHDGLFSPPEPLKLDESR